MRGDTAHVVLRRNRRAAATATMNSNFRPETELTDDTVLNDYMLVMGANALNELSDIRARLREEANALEYGREHPLEFSLATSGRESRARSGASFDFAELDADALPAADGVQPNVDAAEWTELAEIDAAQSQSRLLVGGSDRALDALEAFVDGLSERMASRRAHVLLDKYLDPETEVTVELETLVHLELYRRVFERLEREVRELTENIEQEFKKSRKRTAELRGDVAKLTRDIAADEKRLEELRARLATEAGDAERDRAVAATIAWETENRELYTRERDLRRKLERERRAQRMYRDYREKVITDFAQFERETVERLILMLQMRRRDDDRRARQPGSRQQRMSEVDQRRLWYEMASAPQPSGRAQIASRTFLRERQKLLAEVARENIQRRG